MIKRAHCGLTLWSNVAANVAANVAVNTAANVSVKQSTVLRA